MRNDNNRKLTHNLDDKKINKQYVASSKTETKE